MTKEQIKAIAMVQSAYDYGCNAEDFLKLENTVVISKNTGKQRAYLELPIECSIVTYGNGIVAQVSERTKADVSEYINKYPAEHCFETPNIHVLESSLNKYGLKICFMAEYFLPDIEKLKDIECDYPTRILIPKDFDGLYTDTWSNALCEKRKHLDMLAVGAYDGDKLIALAGASADCQKMWQIGIDVLPEYRGRGIASSLTSKLALETLKLGRVPFYCAAWCNIKSVRNALRSGFYPAWVEMSAKPKSFVENMNK